jgi:putative peptide zinc metalloprotease protein
VAAVQVESLRRQLAAAAVDPAQRPRLLVLQSELQAAEADLGNSAQEIERLELRSPFAGRLADVDPDLQPGEWVSKGSVVAVVAGDGRWDATAYVDASEVQRIRIGDRAQFVPDGAKGRAVELRVEEIDADSSRSLGSGLFASTAGGDIAVRPKNDRLVPEHAIYRVRLSANEVPGDLAGHSWRGRIWIKGAWSSLGWRYLRSAVAVLVRESSF